MQAAAVIVAAGRGTRAGGEKPKQFQRLGDRTVIEHTLAAFRSHPRILRIILVQGPDDTDHWSELQIPDAICVQGGATRSASVAAGLAAVGDGIDHVLIHDGARPLASAALIDRVLDALGHNPAAAPALPVSDALWHGADGQVIGTQARSGLFRAQTPQGFDLDAIRAAHAAFEGTAADDVEVALADGLDVAIVAGDEANIKITGPDDFDRAERLLRGTPLDIRTGNGLDVHRFGPGDHVTLCGIQIPFERGLQGHSDADVAMHVVTDAIYGALAEGDIGQHFPPSDPQWKGTDSAIFLRHAVELAETRGYRFSHCDCTIVCEFPKIGPHTAAMRAKMAELMGLLPDQISVKATTTEKLGFTGRGEGIAALATVTLVAA
ncbi:MAG: bifunctional 2-C-methyl-D-erythritol 4-phosphate cytidylyltransferase/2-C-methyl-D-erythritol 2,4-cyclodiphosphate synthase [Pseudomonadota bacterium]